METSHFFTRTLKTVSWWNSFLTTSLNVSVKLNQVLISASWRTSCVPPGLSRRRRRTQSWWGSWGSLRLNASAGPAWTSASVVNIISCLPEIPRSSLWFYFNTVKNLKSLFLLFDMYSLWLTFNKLSWVRIFLQARAFFANFVTPTLKCFLVFFVCH